MDVSVRELRNHTSRVAAVERAAPRSPSRMNLAPYMGLPGADLVTRGVDELAAGRETPEAMLVAMAAPRLSALGMAMPDVRVECPSHRLYDLLAAEHPDSAHGRYNALVGRIVSFARAAEHARAS